MQMATVAILMGEVAIQVGKAPIRIGTVPIPGWKHFLCKCGALISGGDASIWIVVFPFGIVVLPIWMGMTHLGLESVQNTEGGMPDSGAGAILRCGIAPGRKGSVATRDGGIGTCQAP